MNEQHNTVNEGLITQTELARLCQVSVRTIQNWQKKGLPVWKVTRKSARYRYSEVLDWMKQNGKRSI